MQCTDNKHFTYYFVENMKSLGLPTPTSAFTTLAVTLTDAQVILATIDKFGPKTTMAELIKATVKLERFQVVSGLYASFYAGAAIGSICIALYKTGNCGASLLDAIKLSQHHNIYRAFLIPVWVQFPSILDTSQSTRSIYIRPTKQYQYN